MKRLTAIRLSDLVTSVFFLAGVICIFLLVRHAGWSRLVGELERVGWGFVLYTAIHAAEEAIKTVAWQASFPGALKFNFGKLYFINWMGAAVTQIYHAGILGSGTTRVMMIRKEVTTHQGVASVLISTLADALALILFISGGIVVILMAPEIPKPLKLGLTLAFVLLALSVIIFWALQRKGLLDFIIYVLDKIPIPDAIRSRLIQKTVEVNRSLAGYHKLQTGHFWAAVGILLSRRFLNVLQVHVILSCLEVSGGIRNSILISVFSDLVDALFFFVPGRLGTHEGGRLVISKALGMSTAQGLTLGIVSRLNQILWSLLGVCLYLVYKTKQVRHPSFNADS